MNGNDLRVVNKQLVVHPQTAMTGALAFCAAAKQGKAPQMDTLLWDKGFKARAFDADQCWTTGTCEKVNAFAQEFISGAVPIDNVVSVIDEEMKKANERVQQGTPKAQYYQQWVIDKGLKTLEAPKQ